MRVHFKGKTLRGDQSVHIDTRVYTQYTWTACLMPSLKCTQANTLLCLDQPFYFLNNIITWTSFYLASVTASKVVPTVHFEMLGIAVKVSKCWIWLLNIVLTHFKFI